MGTTLADEAVEDNKRMERNDGTASSISRPASPSDGPLRVYLDSQDFSRFSRSSSEYARFAPVRQRLLQLRDEGRVCFPFSDVHIAECLPIDPSNADGGLDRIRTIAEFSRGDFLPNSGALVEFEVQTLLSSRRRSKKIHELPDEWYGNLELPAGAMVRARNSAHRELREQHGLNRKQRRHVLRLSARDAKAMTDNAFASFGLDDFMSKWPFRPGDRDRVLHAMRSAASHVGVGEALRDGLRDLANFSEWAVRNWDLHGRGFVERLRKPATNVLRAMSQMFEDLQSLNAQYTDEQARSQRKDELRGLIEQARADWFESFPSALAERSLGLKRPPDGFGIRADEHASPSIFLMLNFFLELTAEASRLDQPRDPRKKAANDFADALHVLYRPRVDVFRADRFVSSVLLRSKKNLGGQVAPSLELLPEIVEKLLEARALALT